MKENFNEINIDTLREFTDGDVHDIYLFVKKCYFKDMYMTLYKYGLSKLSMEKTLQEFIKIIMFIYKLQNNLNKALKITDGNYFDEYLMKRCIDEVYKVYGNSETLSEISQEKMLERIIEIRKNSVSTDLSSSQDLKILNALIKDKFNNKETLSVGEITDFINELIPQDKDFEEQTSFTEYLNELICNRNITLNQLGSDSLIKKNIYDISLGKIPTKNQLIAISIALRLTVSESKKLFVLATENVKNTSSSNLFLFDKENSRDILILHWINNIDALQHLAEKRSKNMVSVVNSILKDAGFEALN